MKKIKLSLICIGMLTALCGCGDKTEIKNHLAEIKLENKLPIVGIADCRRLSEADDAVYEQQLAACEMYYEAYTQTETSDFVEMYKDDLKEDKIAFYCNERRNELNDQIEKQLNANIREIVENVEDCDNIKAYVDRTNDDVVNFYDYYAEYTYAERNEKEKAICRILTVFYERSNILAFRFMEDHKSEFIDAAVESILENSNSTEDLNMYISINNELTKSLNTVYGGVPSEYAEVITTANIKLARRLLEEDNDLSEKEIDSLMQQLGEPTPAPTEEPTETPTEEPFKIPIEILQEEMIDIPTERPTLKPTPAPTPVPTPRPTPMPTQPPQVAEPTAPTQPQETYTWEIE